MNTERPHEITRILPNNYQNEPHINGERKWLPITEAEAVKLEAMTIDQRAEWFNKLSIEEKMRRYIQDEKLTDSQ